MVTFTKWGGGVSAWLLAAALLLISCGSKSRKSDMPHVVIQTGYGDIELELYAKQAPKTVQAFLQYVDSGYYKNSQFYRVLTIENQPSNAPKTELIQGGIWKTNYALASTLQGIPHESTTQTGIEHKDGTISLARGAPGTAGSEFFICLGRQKGLDAGGENISDRQGFAAFGRVVKGMSVLRKIYKQRESEQYFRPPIPIYNIVLQ
jgi:peptidyl-prolyl cis-trans isomerase A (cyclophilin A)